MDNQKPSEICGESQPYRLNGKAMLLEAITRIRSKADQYEALMNEIPDDLTPDADEALWLLALSIQR